MALNTNKGSELLSYIINEEPILKENIDLPVQGEDIAPIGKIIVDNERYRNAFINALNLIAVTLITQNDWENPWEEFTEQGKINFGQSVREMIVDLVSAQDYNEHRNSATHFLSHEIPDVYNYVYNINFQKFYKITVNDTEIAMAFTSETGLYDLISNIYSRLYESYKYDKYQVDKYQLCRRIVEGTIPTVYIANFATNTPRQNVAFMKGYANKMAFRSPNYNPAGLRLATALKNQRLILNTDFEAQVTTEVLATSYFLNEAEFKQKASMIDGFNDLDTARLSELLGSQYIPFTEGELTKLASVVGVNIDENFFRDFYYSLDTASESEGATKSTSFYNPETLDNTMWLHVWRIFATSPFANAIVFSTIQPVVTAVDVTPATATVSVGQVVQLKASVTATGLANLAVQWTVDSASAEYGVEIDQNGLLKVPADYTKGTQGVYVVTISTALASGETMSVDGVTYTPAEADTTASAQATALKTLLEANASTSAKYTITRSSGALTFTEKAGKYGVGAPVVVDDALVTGVVAESTTTLGVAGATGTITVTATSIYTNTVSDTATITVA